jgi:ABC-2 type transport system ATP-binding protein
MPGISARNIGKDYENICAADSISFDVDKGELFGMIGPDGAGKTTIIRMLATLLLPDRGSATVEGLDVVKDFRQLRRKLGYMPGKFSLYQDLTVEENLNFFATIFGTSIRENYHLIRDIYLHLEPFRKRRAGALSGGMKQKLALSCALIHKPAVLLLDEPTTGVDSVSRREFWEMLHKLKAHGITILVSTSYMDEARQCDRVALIQGGRILQTEKPEAIISQFGRVLLAVSADAAYPLLLDLQEYPDAESAFPFGDCVHFTSKTNAPDESKIFEYLRGKGHRNIQIRHTEAGIEDCFMRLMNQ